MDVHADSAVAWALLSLVFAAAGSDTPEQQARVRNAQFKAQETAAASASEEPLDSHPFLQLEILLLDLHLGSLAQQVREGAGN